MVDVFIEIVKNQKKTVFEKPFAVLQYLEPYVKFIDDYIFENVRISFIYYGEKTNNLFENDDVIMIALGYTQFRNDYASEFDKKMLSVEELFKFYVINKSNFHKIFKGNYVYIIINKKNKAIEIVNSPFGIIPLYYTIQNGLTYISTNLSLILQKIEEKKINTLSLLEFTVFDCILSNKTFFENIYILQYFEKVYIENNNITYEKYYNFEDLIETNPRKREDTIDQILQVMESNINRFPVDTNFLLALTGGFDGRVNLALLKDEYLKNAILYTYGMPGSDQIKIATLICEKLNLNYKPVYLDSDYENEFAKNGLEAIFLSDGYAPFMRANYLYSHRKLNIYSSNCITGLFGSELIRPIHVEKNSVSINQDVVNIFLNKDTIYYLSKKIKQMKLNGYFQEYIYSDSNIESISNYLTKNYINRLEGLSADKKLFVFYLQEGMRKFFMEEFRIDKFFVNHFLPYLDIDFIETLYKSEYAGIYNNCFKKDPVNRRNGQLLYVDIISKSKNILNNIKVDRGYKPKYFKSKYGMLIIGISYILNSFLLKKIYGNTTFNEKKWAEYIFTNNNIILDKNDPYFSDKLKKIYAQKEPLLYLPTYGRHYSLKIWLDYHNSSSQCFVIK